jgi:hypothetical protein
MDKSRINDMVDRRISDSFREGFSIGAIQSELRVRIKNFTNTITKDGITIEELFDKDFSDIQPIRHRYGITYIKQCRKRIVDLNWIIYNKSKFRGYSNSQVFKLIKFKEKLLTENKLPF